MSIYCDVFPGDDFDIGQAHRLVNLLIATEHISVPAWCRDPSTDERGNVHFSATAAVYRRECRKLWEHASPRVRTLFYLTYAVGGAGYLSRIYSQLKELPADAIHPQVARCLTKHRQRLRDMIAELEECILWTTAPPVAPPATPPAAQTAEEECGRPGRIADPDFDPTL